MNNDEDSDQMRSPPISDLDFQAQTINPQWGQKENVSQEFRDNVIRYKIKNNEQGVPEIKQESVWGDLGFFTRDFRFGNLDKRQVSFCEYHTNLAYDIKHTGYNEAFIVCLVRTTSILELSQSLKGFLRQKQNTLRHEKIEQTIEPAKRGLFGKTGGGDV